MAEENAWITVRNGMEADTVSGRIDTFAPGNKNNRTIMKITRISRKRLLDRTDVRVKRMEKDHGLEGFAVYVLLCDRLRELKGTGFAADYEFWAYDFGVEPSLVKTVVEDYGLFCIESPSQGDAPDAAAAPAPTPAPEPAPAAADSKRKEKQNEKEKLPLHPHKEKETKKEKENRGAEEKKKREGNGDGAEAAAEAESEECRQFVANFVDYWNGALASTNSRLSPISIVNTRRKALLWRLRSRYDNGQIARFVYNAARSPFLNARNGRLSQPADLNWILASDERVVRIIEGSL